MCSPPSSASNHRIWDSRHPLRAGAGFTLVEVMVGLFVGLLITLFIVQIFTLSESQKRSASSSDDALVNGAIALHTLESAIKEAGLGISAGDLLGCRLDLGNGQSLSHLAPLTINHPDVPVGDEGTDTLLMVSSGDFGAPEGNRILAESAASRQFTVAASFAFQSGDSVIVTPKSRTSPCALALDQVTQVTSQTVTLANGFTGAVDGKLFDLGQVPGIRAYAIRGGQLMRCDLMANALCLSDSSVWEPLVSNMVSLKAQYGRDDTPSMDGIVDSYDPAAPSLGSDQCKVARILTVRLALVARAVQYEKTVVPVFLSAVGWAGIDLSQSGADWDHYHYRVFQTVAPLRNIMTGVTGC